MIAAEGEIVHSHWARLGAAAALLWAPASGEETRARLKREARRARERAMELKDDLTEQVTVRAGRVREAVGSKVNSTRNVVDERVRAVGDAVTAGRDAAAQARLELDSAVAETKRAYADSRAAARADRAERTSLAQTDDLSDKDGAATEG